MAISLFQSPLSRKNYHSKQETLGFKNDKEIFMTQFKSEKWYELIKQTSNDPKAEPDVATQYFLSAFARLTLWDSFPKFRSSHFKDPFEQENATSDKILNFALLSIPCDILRGGSFVVHATNAHFPWSCTLYYSSTLSFSLFSFSLSLSLTHTNTHTHTQVRKLDLQGYMICVSRKAMHRAVLSR